MDPFFHYILLEILCPLLHNFPRSFSDYEMAHSYHVMSLLQSLSASIISVSLVLTLGHLSLAQHSSNSAPY